MRWKDDSRPEIEAADSPGEQYGAALVDELAAAEVPAAGWLIEDWPDFSNRGFMLDISRNRVPRMDRLKALAHRLARLRYNELQLYMEHSFAYRGHATVWRGASPLTAEEVAELESVCRDRGIALVPNQNAFGHMERWLRHPEYRPLAESPDGFVHPLSGKQRGPSTLHPCNASAELVADLFGQLREAFSANLLHVGGDEPWELGRGRSRARAESEGRLEVYLDFLNRILATAREAGFTPLCWADILLEQPELAARLSRPALPVIWGYDADHPFEEQCAAVAAAGFAGSFRVAPGCSNWNSFGGRLGTARANIANAAGEGLRHGADGLLLTCWGDNGHHQPFSTAMPGLVLGARAAWRADAPTGDLPGAIDRVFFDGPGNGAAICALGEIDGLLPQPSPPVSFLHHLLFAEGGELAEARRSVDRGQLEAAAERLDAIDCAGCAEEVLLSRALTRAALDKALGRPSDAPGTLAAFERCWLEDCRPGGLPESLALLERGLAAC